MRARSDLGFMDELVDVVPLERPREDIVNPIWLHENSSIFLVLVKAYDLCFDTMFRENLKVLSC